MLDNLILAYRSKFYTWNLKDVVNFWHKNKKITLIFIIFIFVAVAVTIYSLIGKTSIPVFVLLLIELIAIIPIDRLIVKKHQEIISTKKEHIDEVILFLINAIPGHDLSGKNQVDELIARLSIRIDAGAPFNKFISQLRNFVKVIALPIIAYIAGVYSNTVSELDFWFVIDIAVSLILIIGFLYIILGMIYQELQKITCRNYDVAIALKEDLSDIKLLFFTNK